MKLISLITLLATVGCQKIQNEQFPFPPQFQTPSSAMFSSDSSIYLPPESHTPIPFYALNNMNKLPYQFLPPTGTKGPSFFSSPFPIMVSTTLNNIMDDDDNDSTHDELNNRRMVIMRPSQKNINQTQNQFVDKRETKPNTRNSNYQTPFEKFDYKSNLATIPIQKPAARRMIITSEIQRSDSINDQLKAPSFQNAQFIQPPGVIISSSTEPSVPILRLSNEMDLDGSFSYEALGADQTHYVQHSRMENMGTDKEEQVVEGSYSYVGDDGRTYTVHYVADSNGYRATGDHLPVPPPIPEIIQRAVQYNLAEEARRPPHLKSSWENDETDYREESREESKQRIFNIPPPRSLFTGKTPEAFSFGFSQGTNLQNNLATAASFQIPTKTNFDIAKEQSKPKSNVTPISPQITFLASQGAHNPSLQPQPSPPKPTNSEKSSLPSLMNYEADIKKESEQEANKALWRWQYGLNSNTNQAPSKNSISRSSSDGDDIVINFSNMTPEQYTNMIQSQILGQNIESSSVEINNNKHLSTPYSQNIDLYNNNDIKYSEMNTENEKYEFRTSSEKTDYHSNTNDVKQNTDIYSKIITSHNYIPRSNIATQSHNVEISSYKPTEINVLNENYTQNQNIEHQNDYLKNQYIATDNSQQGTTTAEPLSNTINIVNEIKPKIDDKETFKPSIVYNNDINSYKQETETTPLPMKAKIKDNIFLKHLFKESNDEEKVSKDDIVENNNQNDIIMSEPRIEKIPKFIGFQQKPQNEISMLPPKPLDMSDVLNYVIMKNHFESIKTRPKSKPSNTFSQNSNIQETVHYIPIKEDKDERENFRHEQNNDYEPLNREQQHELRGLIKNYKVLQRNKNLGSKIQSIPEPQRHIKTFHSPGLPPLGRAGPSMKSYLPPTYA